MILVTSYHGEEFLEHGGVLHGRTTYGEALSVPLIMRGPGILARKPLRGPAQLSDVFTTVLALQSGSWKLHYDRSSESVELDDLSRDPGELDDLSTRDPDSARPLLDALEAYADIERDAVVLPPLSQERLEALKALGYLN